MEYGALEALYKELRWVKRERPVAARDDRVVQVTVYEKKCIFRGV